MRLEGAQRPPVLGGRSRFFYHFMHTPTTLEGVLPDLQAHLPRGIAKRRLLADLRRKVPILVDRQCGRLRWDFVQRLNEARRGAGRDLGGLIDDTIASLRLGVRRVLDQRAASTRQAELLVGAARQAHAVLDHIAEQAELVLRALEDIDGAKVG